MPRCNICGATGLIPLRSRKDNKLIPFAWTYCECRQEIPEHFYPVSPEDFDFPCAYSWRSYYEEVTTGKPLPFIPLPLEREGGIDPELAQQPIRKIEVIHHYVGEKTKGKY